MTAVLANLSAPYTVESLAAITGMGRSSFAKRFVQAFRQTPIEFVQNVRLHLAAHLLTTTGLPQKVIATSIGFSSGSYFSRTFRPVLLAPRGESRRQSSPALSVLVEMLCYRG